MWPKPVAGRVAAHRNERRDFFPSEGGATLGSIWERIKGGVVRFRKRREQAATRLNRRLFIGGAAVPGLELLTWQRYWISVLAH
jgi:hypothetical protein